MRTAVAGGATGIKQQTRLRVGRYWQAAESHGAGKSMIHVWGWIQGAIEGVGFMI